MFPNKVYFSQVYGPKLFRFALYPAFVSHDGLWWTIIIAWYYVKCNAVKTWLNILSWQELGLVDAADVLSSSLPWEVDNYSVCDHLSQFHYNFFKGVRQCRPEDHLGGVLLLPPSEVRQAAGHLSSSWERSRKWGTQPARKSRSQKEGTAGIEQDEEVRNVVLLNS